MRPILVLTKNLLTEQTLQEQLQHLNYEVFCSVAMLEQIKQSPNRKQMIESYQAIIFSETLTDQEIRELLIYVNDENNLLVRKLIHQPSEQETEKLHQMGIDLWIFEGESLDLMREQLAIQLVSCQNKESSDVVFLYQKEHSPRSLEDFKECLSKNERLTFDCLIQENGRLVSREALCYHLWEGPPNNSRLTQISVIVKRLKLKLRNVGFHEDLIDTVWGQGYRLSPKLLQFYD
ncbi:helix-turn-helix domain-containing protein [Enterococcus sp. AZ163]|uniref:helix-turn-helix domain-containing protein n=1 Tax=Enterococcus sp. AZ163 TaxID=2774638 RepID=UPI003D298721